MKEEKYKGIPLRFRPDYIPVREEPEWAHESLSGST
jgi:hypothetical protein